MNIISITSGSPKALDYALKYAAIGWPVFPVWGAKDGRCLCGRLCKSPGKHPVEYLVPRGQDDATTEKATITRWWSSAPEAGIAVYLGKAGLCAIDIDPRNGGFETMDIIESQHGPLVSDVMAFTQGGGEHRIFKLSADVSLPGKLGPGVDVKRNGYIVLAPSRGVSGVYEWEASSDPLENCIPSPLPDWVRDISSAPRAADAAVTPASARFVTPAQVLELKEALSFINPDDYHQWINIGQALHSIGSQGFGLWNNWSMLSDKYDAAEMGKKWRSFKPGAINYESVFKLAQNAGWANPLSSAALKRDKDLAALVAAHSKVKTVEVVKEAPATIRPFPVPMLNEVSSWICRSQGIKPCVAVQMTVLSAVSLAASRNFVSENGDGAHIYQLISGQTVGELRSLHNAIVQLIGDANLRKILREQRFTSSSGLLKTLFKAPATLYLSSDWGAMAAFARRQPSGVTEQVMQQIANIYTQDEILIDNIDEIGIKSSAITEDMPRLCKPSLSVMAISSLCMLVQTFASHEIGRGAVEQFIYHAADIEISHDARPEKPPVWVTSHIRRIRGLTEFGGGVNLDLQSIFAGNAELMPKQTVVTFAEPPDSYYAAFDAVASGNRIARQLVIMARANFRRLCVGMAAWANNETPVATQEIMDWCAAFVADRLSESLAALRLVGGSEDGKATIYQMVLEAIERGGSGGVTISGLVHSVYKFRSLTTVKRKELISQLVDDDMIIERRGINGKGDRIISARFVIDPDKVATDEKDQRAAIEKLVLEKIEAEGTAGASIKTLIRSIYKFRALTETGQRAIFDSLIFNNQVFERKSSNGKGLCVVSMRHFDKTRHEQDTQDTNKLR